MGSWIRGVVTHAKAAPVRFSLVAATAALLVGATAYLGTASVLWYVRVGDLQQANKDLAGALSEQASTTRTHAELIVPLGTQLDSVQTTVFDEAHRKALMQDDQIAYREIAGVLKQCAVKRSDVLTEVQNRGRYILWTVHRYDDGVTSACTPVVTALREQIAGESK
jgi:hypothetical protein